MLDAAERVIGRAGFHGAGMAEIAREAEYAIGTLYNCFPSKEALYERLLVTRAEEISAGIRAAIAGPGTARERLEAVLLAKLDWFARHRDFVLIYATSSIVAMAGWGLPAEVAKMREENQRAIARLLAGARARGELGVEADPADLALAYQSISQGFLIAAVRTPGAFPVERVRRQMRQVFFDPIFGTRCAARATKRRVRP